MEVLFETYGPFLLKRDEDVVSPDDVDDLFDDIEEQSGIDLRRAKGVYVISMQRGSSIKPWYVGKSDEGFRNRLRGHANSLQLFASLHKHAPKEVVQVLFIARQEAKKRKLKVAKKSGRKSANIDFLESFLIGACFAQNKLLINEKKLSKHKNLVVPGLMNDQSRKPNQAATYLRKVVGLAD